MFWTEVYEKAKAAATDNVYDWMAEHAWTGHLIDAFRGMYLGERVA